MSPGPSAPFAPQGGRSPPAAPGPVALARELSGFLAFVARRFQRDRGFEAAASLAYTTLISLVPLIAIALSVLSSFPVFGVFVGALEGFLLANMVPDAARHIITEYLPQFSQNAGRLTALGVASLCITALALMLTIERELNGIWRARSRRPPLQRFLTYWAVLTLGPILVGASLSLTSYFVSVSIGLTHHIVGLDRFVVRAVPLLLTTVAFALLYWVVPSAPVRKRHALAAGLAAALCFEAAKRLFAMYVAAVPAYRLVYGAFATLPIFLLWIYLSWVVVLAGAEFAAALPYLSRNVWRRSLATPEATFVTALELLQRLEQGLRAGVRPSVDELAGQVGLAPDDVRATIITLVGTGLVRDDASGVALGRHPAEIRLVDVYRATVTGPRDPSRTHVTGTYGVPWEAIDGALDTALGVTLEAWCSRGRHGS